MKYTNCGQECHDNQEPEIVFTDDKNCKERSIDFEDTL